MSRETPFQGSCGVCGNEPRALPWAGMRQAFGLRHRRGPSAKLASYSFALVHGFGGRATFLATSWHGIRFERSAWRRRPCRTGSTAYGDSDVQSKDTLSHKG
jgi:hypothetical protein